MKEWILIVMNSIKRGDLTHAPSSGWVRVHGAPWNTSHPEDRSGGKRRQIRQRHGTSACPRCSHCGKEGHIAVNCWTGQGLGARLSTSTLVPTVQRPGNVSGPSHGGRHP